MPFLVPPKWVKWSVLANFPVEFRLPGTNRQNENGRTNLRSRVAGLLGKENLPCAASVDVNMGVAAAQMIEPDPKPTQTNFPLEYTFQAVWEWLGQCTDAVRHWVWEMTWKWKSSQLSSLPQLHSQIQTWKSHQLVNICLGKSGDFMDPDGLVDRIKLFWPNEPLTRPQTKQQRCCLKQSYCSLNHLHPSESITK